MNVKECKSRKHIRNKNIPELAYQVFCHDVSRLYHSSKIVHVGKVGKKNALIEMMVLDFLKCQPTLSGLTSGLKKVMSKS